MPPSKIKAATKYLSNKNHSYAEIIFLQFVSLLFVSFLKGQETIRVKPRIYNITVSLDSAKTSSFGYLASISDSSLFISPATVYFTTNQKGNVNAAKIDYSNLTQVQLRRKGSTGRGILKGTAAGLFSEQF